MKISHILLTSDLSTEALRPCALVAEMARVLGARITLLHLTVDAPIVGPKVPVESVRSSLAANEQITSARDRLENQLALFQGLDVAVEVVPGFDPAYQIVEFAQANGVDLIAMSTHGRRGFRHLLLGRTAEGVLRRSTVPVVVFPCPVTEAQWEKTARWFSARKCADGSGGEPDRLAVEIEET